jgi:membrane protein DedA with SNARE-associated domain
MKQNQKHTLLGIPAIIWVLQLLYVALALGLLIFFHSSFNTRSSQALYVLVMLMIDIAWRVTIKKKKPEWFA